MYVRLAFAVAVHVDPDVLLVDEVLAVGDEPFQRKCMDRIKAFQKEGRTIVLVTHALDQVADVCDRAVVLEHGKVVVDGTAREAIRTLRADFDEQATTEREAAAAAAAAAASSASASAPVQPPARQARVVTVEAFDGEGRPVRTHELGTDLVVRVTVEAEELVRDWVVGIGIDTPTGHQVFGTNTQLLNMPLEPFVGRRSIDVRLSELYLGEGDYHLHGALAEWSGPTFHRLSEAASLSVEGSRRSIGSVGVREIAAGVVADAVGAQAG